MQNKPFLEPIETKIEKYPYEKSEKTTEKDRNRETIDNFLENIDIVTF